MPLESKQTDAVIGDRCARRQKPSFGPGKQRVQTLHLFVLTAFAVAQPVYDRVGKRPTFLADMGVGPAAFVLIGVAFSLVLPLVVSALIWGTGKLAPRARSPLHVVVVDFLVTVAVAPFTYEMLLLPDWMAVGLAFASGAFVTWAYFRFHVVRVVASVASPAIVAFPAMFLLTSPAALDFFFSPSKIETARWKPVPVVMVVLDELCGMSLVDEQGNIDAVRYPHFAELARESTWFRNATAVYPYTWQAVPAILSSRYPSMKRPPTLADRPQNLFSVLAATGAWESTVFEPISRLAETKREPRANRNSGALQQLVSMLPAVGSVWLYDVSPPLLRSRLPAIPQIWFGSYELASVDAAQRRGVIRYAVGDDRQAQVDHFLNCLEDSSHPQLYFLHVLLPHSPWCYFPSGRRFFDDRTTSDVMFDALAVDELFVEHCQQRYLLQLQFTDVQIGRLLARLCETGIYDKCLLIVTADHGVTFKVGDTARAATEQSLPDVMSVPLFVKAPGQKTGILSDRNVESVDLLPTVTDFLGIDLQFPIDGRSVFDAGAERPEKILHTEETVGGAPIRVSAAIMNRSRVRQELRQRFGAASDPESLFRIGPCADLIGLRAADRAQRADSSVEISLSPETAVYWHDQESIVPCAFEGRVTAPAVTENPVALAVAVNGTIRATTRTYRLDGFRDRFFVMFPESALHEGPNDVQFYSVSGSSPDYRLTPCSVRKSGPD
ncbi:MAG: sulfatase-like hydrolase/transferase [Planctomycetia bacterium]|nr:sulfatase-like hydrolase/transferase [Planctomycetia bacterium]